MKKAMVVNVGSGHRPDGKGDGWVGPRSYMSLEVFVRLNKTVEREKVINILNLFKAPPMRVRRHQ